MSIRSTVATGSWQNIGTGPATVQLIAAAGTGAEVMVLCAASEPTGNDGLVLNQVYPAHEFTLADTIWAQAINVAALVAVQPEVAP